MIPAESDGLALPGDLHAMGSAYVTTNYCGGAARRHIVVRRARLVSSLLGLSHGNVIDLGCGPGYSSALLARRVTRVTAVDIDETKLAIARTIARLNGVRVDVALVDASRPLPFRTGQFDGLVSLELIEHLRDWRATILEMCRVVKPRGRIAISTPTRHGAAQIVKSAMLRSGLLEESTYEWFIPRRMMLDALKEGGIEVTAVEFAIFAAPQTPDAALPLLRPLEQVVESLPLVNRLCSTAIYCGIRR